jgi:glucose-1-phosphate thymidylyltransferase
MKCLIPAGGFGRRLYPITINVPKALLPYRGKPLIDYILTRIPGGLDVFISTNKRFAQAFTDWQKTQERNTQICIEEAQNEQEKLGAVSSIDYWIKKQNFAEDLLVIAADNYFEFDIARFVAAFDGRHTLMAIYDIADREKAKQFGVVELSGSKVVAIEEKPTAPKSTLVSTACYVFPKRILPLFSAYCQGGKRDNLGNFISYVVEKDEVRGFQFTELWFDIGSEPEVISTLMQAPPGTKT